MTYNTVNVTTMSGLIGTVATEVPAFIPMTLFSLFVISLMASYYSQLRMRGFADFWMSWAVSGYFVSVVAIIMSLNKTIPISPFIVLTCIVISIIGTIMIFFGKDEI